MSRAIVIPTLGGPWLERCLEAVSDLRPAADRVVVVLSGSCRPLPTRAGVTLIRLEGRAGFAAATNVGVAAVRQHSKAIAVLNDDAVPAAGWLGRLGEALEREPLLAAVQGTVIDTSATKVDGCGITFDRWGLPTQLGHGLELRPESLQPDLTRQLIGVSATAALYRSSALDEVALEGGQVFDETLGSYHEDLDLALRLLRCGWQAAWISGAECRHLGSASASRFPWRHPWWLLANRWQVLAANLEARALFRTLPRLLRGEMRAARTLTRQNPRALAVAPVVLMSLPGLLVRGWTRPSRAPRLGSLPIRQQSRYTTPEECT